MPTPKPVVAQLLKDKREEILSLAAKHRAKNVRVFGAVARGTAGPDSDVDFPVDVSRDHSPWFPGGLVAEFEDLLECRIDMVTENSLHPYLRERVLREAIALRRTTGHTSIILGTALVESSKCSGNLKIKAWDT